MFKPLFVVCFLSVSAAALAAPIQLSPSDFKTAETMRLAFADLTSKVTAAHDFAKDVADRCECEDDWEKEGVKADFNASSGKAIGRLVDLAAPTSRVDAVKYVATVKGAWSVRSSFNKNKKAKGKGAYGVKDSGAAAWADPETLATYTAFCKSYEAFVATKCNVSNPIHWRYLEHDYEAAPEPSAKK